MTENERRKFLKASLAAMAAATGVGLSGCRPKQSGTVCYMPAQPWLEMEKTPQPEPAPEEPVTPPTEPTDEKAANREDLAEKLKELGEKEPPKDYDFDEGAMCYVMEMPEGWDS